MSIRLRLSISIIALLTISLLAGTAAMQQKPPSSGRVRVLSTQQEANAREQEQQLPVVEYNAPEPTDPAKRALRRLRSRRHNLTDPSVKGSDVSRFVLTERSARVNLGGPWSHAPEEPAIPVTESDAILVGDIVGANAFLSTDKTSIYSEFNVLVLEVIKDSSATITTGAPVTIERSGGALRFPSGKVLIRGLLGKPLPLISRRYVFFLKRNTEGEDFSIITAYELRGGQVFPLDGTSPKGDVVAPFALHQKYKGVDGSTFLITVRTLTQSSLGSG
jgi:hypothetical protein